MIILFIRFNNTISDNKPLHPYNRCKFEVDSHYNRYKWVQVDKPDLKSQVDKPDLKSQVDKPDLKSQVDKPDLKSQVDKPDLKSQVDKPDLKSQVDKLGFWKDHLYWLLQCLLLGSSINCIDRFDVTRRE